ncbi:MAG: hypothetical protein M3Z66_14250, partial [Chloroflexota bacterium]|nr:hypothetical protein [Chloroflexota bacterium]
MIRLNQARPTRLAGQGTTPPAKARSSRKREATVGAIAAAIVLANAAFIVVLWLRGGGVSGV